MKDKSRRRNLYIIAGPNGKVVRIPADQIEVREPEVEYSVTRKKS